MLEPHLSTWRKYQVVFASLTDIDLSANEMAFKYVCCVLFVFVLVHALSNLACLVDQSLTFSITLAIKVTKMLVYGALLLLHCL